MDVAVVVVLAVGAVAVALWTYLRREPPVRGRGLLALLRAATLVLLVLLLWNPAVRVGAGGDEVRAPRVLLDASLSMSAADSGGATPWRAAVERARELAGPDGRVLLFGSSVRVVPADSLADDRPPGDAGSSLAPALERVAALGGTSVRVLSDFRLEDPVAVSAALEETGLGVRFEDVGRAVRNAGVVELGAPASLDAGEAGAVEVLLAGETGDAPGLGGEGEGGVADSVSLELRADGRLLAARRVPLPGRGRPERHALEFTAPEARGSHRLEVAARLSRDGFEPDDRRVAFLEVDPARAGLVLLSLTPDWEPRYLLPVLEQVTGLEARGFLRLSGGRWLPMGTEDLRSAPLDEERVRELSGEAGFVVLHGVGGDPPAWVRELASTADRLLLSPEEPAASGLVGVPVTGWQEGEWYADGELPASPLAGDLVGATFEGLPPLTALLPVAGDPPSERIPLRVRRGRQGPSRPALILVPGDDRRAVFVLASGFWRWAARDGAPRETYRRLWSAASGWLLERPAEETVAGVEPAARPAPRGAPVEWRVRGPAGDTLDVRVERAREGGDAAGADDADAGAADAGAPADSAALDTTVVRAGSLVRTRPLAPGRYRYRVRAPGLGEDATGELEVSAFSDELLRPRLEPPGAASGDVAGAPAGGPGRPLRTHPAPYLVLLLLLSAEWIGRRRQGLR